MCRWSSYVVKEPATSTVCYDQSSHETEIYSLTTLTEVHVYVALKSLAHELYKLLQLASYLGDDFMYTSNFMLYI